MPKPCSLDLRERVVEAVESGAYRDVRQPSSSTSAPVRQSNG